MAALYNIDGKNIYLNGGKPVHITLSTLPEIVARHVATERLVQLPNGGLAVEHRSVAAPW
jgi:hypothetical protein